MFENPPTLSNGWTFFLGPAECVSSKHLADRCQQASKPKCRRSVVPVTAFLIEITANGSSVVAGAIIRPSPLVCQVSWTKPLRVFPRVLDSP